MARATTPATTLQQSVDLLEQDVNDFHNILNGDANTTVPLDDGPVDSIRKSLADMAAYKTPIAWSQGSTATDILQPRTFSGNAYVPTTVPVVMGAAPDATWKLYSYTVTEVDDIDINQLSGDDEAIRIKRSSVSQPYTAFVSTADNTVAGFIEPIGDTIGGVQLHGLTGGVGTIGLSLIGFAETTTNLDTQTGPVQLRGGTGTGPGVVALAAGENLVTITNHLSSVANFKGNGDLKTQGGVYAVGDIQGLSSDERLKENIKPIEDAVAKVKELNGVTFNFNSKGKSFGLPEEDQVGLIAQDVEKVIPEAVMPFAFDPEYKNVKYDKLVALLVESVKELTARVEELENGSTK